MSQQLFKFHFGRGDSLSVWAEDQKSAIKRFREMMGTTVFMTDVEMMRVKREALAGRQKLIAERKAKNAKADKADAEKPITKEHPFLQAA